MLPTILVALLVFAVPVNGLEEVWEGTLELETAHAPKPRKNPSGGKQHAKSVPLSIKIKRSGTKFTGEWIEGPRALEIAGVIKNRQFEAVPTRNKRGTWQTAILQDLSFEGRFDKDELTGTMYGAGKKKQRGGTFTVRRKAGSPGEVSEK